MPPQTTGNAPWFPSLENPGTSNYRKDRRPWRESVMIPGDAPIRGVSPMAGVTPPLSRGFGVDRVLAEGLADEVGDLRLLVHALADPVADELLDDAHALALDVLLHQGRHLGPGPAASHGADGQVESVLRHLEEPLVLGGD